MITKDELFKHTENKDGNKVRIDKNIRCSENKSEYLYINKSGHRVAKIKVDGALVAATDTKKCDYLLVNWNSTHSLFIELKGSDVKKAICQINTTLDLLWTSLKGMGMSVAHARIVLSKTPRPNLMPIEKRKLDLRLKAKEYGFGTIKVQSEKMLETF